MTAAAPAEVQAGIEAGDAAALDRIARREAEAAEPLALDAAETAACELFAALQTQWRRVDGLPVGLDYAAVPATAQLAEIEMDAERFRCLQRMEAVAAEAIRKRAARRPRAQAACS